MSVLAENLWRSHNLEQSKGSDGITTSGSFSFWEDTPVSPLNIGDEFQPVPGGPTLKVGKINISDSVVGERFGRPFRQWQITVEGDSSVQSDDDDDSDTNVKYTFTIEKSDDGIIKNAGTMEVANTGAAPSLSVDIGDSFTVPGIGTVDCTKVSGGDEYTNSGAHKWTVTYEGARTEQSGGDDTGDTNVKYTFLIEKSDEGIARRTGTMEVANTGANPSITVELDGTFNVPGVGEVPCTKVSGGDEYTSSGAHKWTVTYEGTKSEASEGDGDTNVKYTFAIEKSDDGITKRTGTMEVTNTGASPSITLNVGDSFNVPGVGSVTCTKVGGGDEYTDSGARKWTITYEGASVEAGGGEGDDDISLPDSEEELTYEINGTTARSVSGEFIVLRRSTTPITKKSLTVYTKTATRLTTPGDSYSGGIAVSETVTKETQTVNNIEIGSYYCHSIEVES